MNRAVVQPLQSAVGNAGQQYNNVAQNVQNYFQPTAQVRPRDFVRELPGAIGSVASDIAHTVPRIAGNTMATLSNQTLNPSDLGVVGRGIFGSEPMKPYTVQGQEAAQRFGLKSPLAAPLLAMGSVGLDFSNAFMPGDSSVGKIAASKSAEEIAQLLKGRVADSVLPSLAEHLVTVNKPEEVSALISSINKLHPTAGLPHPDLSPSAVPDFTPHASPVTPAPSLDNFPLLSGRTPLPGMDKPFSALQTSREIVTGRGKSVMVTGAPETLTGGSAQITKMGKGMNRVVINNEPAPLNAALKDTPLLPAGETPPPMIALPSGPTRNTPMTTFGDVEKALYGHESFTPTPGGKTGIGIVGDTLRNVEMKIDGVVSGMLSSPNPILRTVANTLRGFAGGLGKTKEFMNQVTGFHGQSDYGTKLAEDFQQMMPSDPVAMKNLLSHLDPAITGGITKPLDAAGQEQLSVARVVSDFINDTNYKNGFINEEQWMKNRGGRYIARAYDQYDMPPEIADFMKTATAKLDLNPFKHREDLNQWKIDHAILDPGYLLGKRLQQTVFNDSTKGMFDWLSSQAQYVSDVAKGGYSQIAEHPAYGTLSGKFVRKDVMESIRGLYFEHQWLQKAYDLLKAWDSNSVRRGLKKTMTVYNPAVRAGNVFGNDVFAHMAGINPVTFGKEFLSTPSLVNTKDPFALRLIREGVLGSGAHKGDIVKYAEELKQGVTDKATLSKIDDIVSKSYGETDDRAKYVAMKMLLKDGLSWDEAKFRVMSGFQNYHNIGFLYDIGSKLPVLGNPFVRFQASMMTILKNAARDHPIRAIGTGLLLTYFQDMMSRISGETPQDRATRESRVGAPHFPFTNISLTVQTPWGEVNPARMIGMYSGNPVGGNTVSNDLSRVMPIKSPWDARNWGSDPVVGPLISLGSDTNFQGKSIADPSATKFKPSTLTPTEKIGNQAKFLQRAYTPSFLNTLGDVGASLQGKPDYYGRTRSPLQAISSAAGVKVEQYGPQQAQDQRAKDAVFAQYAKEDTKRAVNAVLKDRLSGKIDQATADARIKNLTSGLADNSAASTASGDARIAPNPMGGYSYTDANGDLKNPKTLQEAQRAVAKMDFVSSGKNIMFWNDRVFRMGEDGVTVSDVSKSKYDSQLIGAQLTGARDTEDLQGWFSLAKQQYQNFQKQLQDPNTDPEEAQSIQNQIHTLVKQAALYSRYGGFTKPKIGKKPKKVTFKGGLKTFSTKATTTKTPALKLKPIHFAPPTIDLKPYKVK